MLQELMIQEGQRLMVKGLGVCIALGPLDAENHVEVIDRWNEIKMIHADNVLW